ncbi:UDP-N-acetylglucosamine 2-epimerase, partial [Faecalitalea cylindroides]|uniref:UDP-N-acetylglucosamine 2-epimerase n=1 Tax=Faecalitalea cylindroides TaxID=39483 RepID=UPI001F135CA9
YKKEDTEFYPAFGNNAIRMEWLRRLEENQCRIASFVHPAAYVSPKATVGTGCVILPMSVINTNVLIEKGCIINCGAVIDHDCIIREGCHICLNATIKANNTIPACTKIEASDIHERLNLEKGKYILLSAHREENIDTEKNFLSLFNAINKMAEKYDMPILYSCHPRSKKRLETSGFKLDPRVIQHEPLGFHDYNCLQMNAYAVVSDSGTLPEESSFFTSVRHPFPAICIRTSTERPEALDKGDFILAGIDERSLLQAVDTAVELNKNNDLGIPVPDYVDENVSTKVVKIIQSYTGVVNKMV